MPTRRRLVTAVCTLLGSSVAGCLSQSDDGDSRGLPVRVSNDDIESHTVSVRIEGDDATRWSREVELDPDGSRELGVPEADAATPFELVVVTGDRRRSRTVDAHDVYRIEIGVESDDVSFTVTVQ